MKDDLSTSSDSVGEQQSESDYSYDILANQKLTLNNVLDHMTGPMISVVLHIVVISFICTIAIFKPTPEHNDLEIEMVEMEIKPMKEPPPPPEPVDEIVTDEVEVSVGIDDVDSMSSIEAPVASIDTESIADSSGGLDVSSILGENTVLGNNSALIMDLGVKTTNFLGGRETGGTAPIKLKDVVKKGLAWLATRKRDDGTFRIGAHPNAKWGVCTLAFLGSGNSTRKGKYKDLVKKSIDVMLETQGKDGSIGYHSHATPFIALALLDACALEPKDKKLRAGAQKILKYALNTQQNNGCWSGSNKANPKKCTDVDITATGWWTMALISGRLAGLNVPEKNLRRLKKTLTQIAEKKFKGKVMVSTHGGMSNSFNREVSIDSTLLTILQFLGTDRSAPIIQKLAGRLHGSRKNFDQLNFWTMYQQGIGVFQLGQTNSYWFGFVVDVITKLTDNQNSEGYWSSKSAFDKKGQGENGGTISYWGDEGNTAMAILNLQVYFRYGSIHEMYERHGRLIPQKSKRKSKSIADEAKSDIEDLGIVF